MSRPNHLEQVRKRIGKAEAGAVFIPSDFFDITEAVKVNTCLNRLVDSGELTRLMRGVFAKPRYSTLLQTNVPPCSDEIARAIARNYGWTIVPCGDTALNMLGLSTQIPAVWIYVSDGPYKSYDAGGILLRFKHTANKNIAGISYKSALTIQALKALGKGNVADNTKRQLAAILTEDEKSTFLAETQYGTAWIHEFARELSAI